MPPNQIPHFFLSILLSQANLSTAILQPSRLHLLKSAQPNVAFPNTVVANTGRFLVSQDRQYISVLVSTVSQLKYKIKQELALCRLTITRRPTKYRWPTCILQWPCITGIWLSAGYFFPFRLFIQSIQWQPIERLHR